MSDSTKHNKPIQGTKNGQMSNKSSISLHRHKSHPKAAARTPLQYTFGSIPLSTSTFASSSTSKQFQLASTSLKLRRSARLRCEADNKFTQKWLITPASSTIRRNIPLKDASHSYTSLSSITSIHQPSDSSFTISSNPPSTMSAVTQGTSYSANDNSNCWSTSVATQDDLTIDCDNIAHEYHSEYDDHEFEYEQSVKKRITRTSLKLLNTSTSSICTRQNIVAKEQESKRKHEDDYQGFYGVMNTECPQCQSMTKKKRHSYRLRSLSYQNDDCFSFEDNEENNIQKFLDMDDVSNVILSAKETGMTKIRLLPRSFSNSCLNDGDSTLTCAYLASYGSLYFQSLLERETLQIEATKKRLNDFSITQQSCHNVNQDSQNKLEVTQQRIRTRSCGKLKGEISANIADDEECNSEKPNGDKHSCNKANDGENIAQRQKNTSAYPRYMQVGKQKYITVDTRTILVDWIIDVTMEFKLSHETLHCCICLIDRCLEDIVVTRETFHSLGCACLLIASKLTETKNPRAVDIAFFTNGACNVKDISTMELEIVKVLQFHLQFVTSFHYTERFLNASNLCIVDEKKSKVSKTLRIDQYVYIANPKLECMLMYFVDMSLLIPQLVDTKKSLIAASALYISRAVMGIKDSEGYGCYWSDALAYYTGYDMDELVDTVTLLHNRRELLEQNNREQDALTKKYKRKEYFEVASKSTTLFEDLKLYREQNRWI